MHAGPGNLLSFCRVGLSRVSKSSLVANAARRCLTNDIDEQAAHATISFPTIIIAYTLSITTYCAAAATAACSDAFVSCSDAFVSSSTELSFLSTVLSTAISSTVSAVGTCVAATPTVFTRHRRCHQQTVPSLA